MVRYKMMDYIIVPMTWEHIEQISEIECISFSLPWSMDAFKSELTNPYARYFVAVAEGVVAGYIGCHFLLGEGYITNVAVAPPYRRMGIGEALIRELIAYCEKENGDFVTLEVRRSNSSAISLYEKMGFRAVGERKKYYSEPVEDALLMTLFFENGDNL